MPPFLSLYAEQFTIQSALCQHFNKTGLMAVNKNFVSLRFLRGEKIVIRNPSEIILFAILFIFDTMHKSTERKLFLKGNKL